MSMWLGDLTGSEVDGFHHAFLSRQIRKIFGHETCHFSDLGIVAAKRWATNFSPARTARSASSSWACGYPKFTSTPAPMYFATKPPKRRTVSATHF